MGVLYKKISKQLSYKENTVLSYEIVYPEITGYGNEIGKLNEKIREEALLNAKKTEERYFPKAALAFDATDEGEDFFSPFIIKDATMVTEENENIISLFSVLNENTGGGSIYSGRSVTYDVNTGKTLTLSNFIKGSDLKARVTETVKSSIMEEIKNGEKGYLFDWERRVTELFKPKNFYISDNVPVIYYGQDDLMLHRYGIKEFKINLNLNSTIF